MHSRCNCLQATPTARVEQRAREVRRAGARLIIALMLLGKMRSIEFI